VLSEIIFVFLEPFPRAAWQIQEVPWDPPYLPEGAAQCQGMTESILTIQART
jgi:hypothetical protein